MLTIVCGEDSIGSRDYFLQLRQDYTDKGNEIHDIKPVEIDEILKSPSGTQSLFSQTLVFFTEGLNKKISKRSNQKLFDVAEKLSKKKDIELIDWEDSTSTRDLKLSKGVTIKEFKLPVSIFKLLDTCYPKNLKNFVRILYSLPDKLDDMFIFIMLIRHIHNLFVIKNGGVVKSIQSWQVAKVKSQASSWNVEKLNSFYESLYRIEVRLKTGKNPFSLRKSLDLLACYFL